MQPMYRKIEHQISNNLKRNQNKLPQKPIFSVNVIPNISLTPANVITNDATNKSAIARDAKNKFPILLKLRSV